MTTATSALVYDAHAYTPLTEAEDPHGHGSDCGCKPACSQCGSAKDAYIHTEEAADKHGTLVVRQQAAEDTAQATDRAVDAFGGSPDTPDVLPDTQPYVPETAGTATLIDDPNA